MSTLLPEAKDVYESTSIYADKTWKLDLDQKRVSGHIDGIDACRQAALVAISTEKAAHLIYTPDFGSELSSLIGRSFDYVKAAAPRLLRECLKRDDRVSDVSDFRFFRDGEAVTVSFTVQTEDGSFESGALIG